ncbi:NUDIX domain-containing protein [Candidatus Harpocratesius sp.]
MNIFGEKKKRIRYIPRQSAYIIFFNKNNEIGVIQTHKGLFLPGGGKNNNESDEECLKRELNEELGWDIEIGNFIGQGIQFINSNEKSYKSECRFYLGKKFSKTSDPIEKDHTLKWFPIEHLVQNLYVDIQKWAIKEAVKFINIKI